MSKRRPLARLRPSIEACQNMSKARLGKTHSPETKAKIAASLRGHAVSAETREKISAARKAMPPRTLENVLLEGKKHAKARWSWMATTRTLRWKNDQRAALLADNQELWQDVKQSGGWTAKRRMKGYGYLGVSDGYWGRDLRAEFAAWRRARPYEFKRKVMEQGKQPSLYRKKTCDD